MYQYVTKSKAPPAQKVHRLKKRKKSKHKNSNILACRLASSCVPVHPHGRLLNTWVGKWQMSMSYQLHLSMLVKYYKAKQFLHSMKSPLTHNLLPHKAQYWDRFEQIANKYAFEFGHAVWGRSVCQYVAVLLVCSIIKLWSLLAGNAFEFVRNCIFWGVGTVPRANLLILLVTITNITISSVLWTVP